MNESIESLRNLSLTERDFDLMVQGLEHLPNKDTAGELMGELLFGAIVKDEEERQKMKMDRDRQRAQQMREKQALVEDSKILQGKLLMLKRFLIENDLLKEANSIINPK